MKRLILIPLLFISAFGFSQQIDTLLGLKGKLKIDTALTVDGNYLFTPSQNHISFDSTKLIWFLNGSKVYTDFSQVGIGSHTPRAKFMISDSVGSVGNNDSTGIMLVNDTTDYSPSVTFSSKYLNSTAGAYQPFKFRMFSNNIGGNPVAGKLHIQKSSNNGAYSDILLYTNTGWSFTGPINSTGDNTFGNSVTTTQVYANYLIMGGFVGTYNITTTTNYGGGTGGMINATPTINAPTSGANYMYTAFNFNPTLTNIYGTKVYGFKNVVGENQFNTSSGSSGFGVADSVNGSAKVEIRDTAKGFLLPRMTKAQRNKIISSISGSITAGGTGAVTSKSNVAMLGGSGTGAIASIHGTSGAVDIVTFTSLGSGYVAGDVLTATGYTGFTYTISAVGAPATALMIWQTDNTPGPRWFDGTNWMKTTLTADP